jgi:hypothetical protein
MRKGDAGSAEDKLLKKESAQGIVVTDRNAGRSVSTGRPRIAAFIWGGKVRPTPTLPYGRWKGAA